MDVVEAVGVAEAQKPLAIAAERRARQTRYAGFLQQSIGQVVTREAGAGDVREGVKSPIRLETADARQRVQAGDDGRPAAREFVDHARDGFLWAVERGDGGLLRKAGRAAHRVGDEPLDVGHELGWKDAK